MSALVQCPTCSRHARAAEPSCPFCASSLAAASPGAVRGVSRRELTRNAIVLGAASLLGACASRDPAEDRETGDDTGGGEHTDGDVLVGDDHEEDRRHRRAPCAPDDMACMTMPYGAPAMPDPWV